MTQIGSSNPTYDANGDVTNDSLNTYAWDANGRPITIDGVGATYDALGDMVEQNRSGAYTQIVYFPSGGKLALMNGTTLQKGFVPLVGGSMAVYNSSGLWYYRHSDWLGSSRLASTPGRAIYADIAYAPFGETYAPSGTADPSFTGQNQDTVSNLYDFPAREYSGIQGRWPSPDPAGTLSVDPIDPQTWNRYAYVRNSPLVLTDPTGEDPPPDCPGCPPITSTTTDYLPGYCDQTCEGMLEIFFGQPSGISALFSLLPPGGGGRRRCQQLRAAAAANDELHSQQRKNHRTGPRAGTRPRCFRTLSFSASRHGGDRPNGPGSLSGRSDK